MEVGSTVQWKLFASYEGVMFVMYGETVLW